MYFEAKGLDVTPNMIDKLKKVNDQSSIKCLKKIYYEEINHVRKKHTEKDVTFCNKA